MKAVIMAGGFGTRIQPLTSSMPKPMIPVLNRPMMEYILLSLKNAGITDIVILLYFMPEVIKNYFGDGSKFGVKITYCLPKDDYGTAGAVKKAAEFLDERFIIISGDLITDFNLTEVIGFHDTHKSFATLALTSVEDPLQFGVVMTDNTGKIIKFLEKPGWGEVFSDTINTGIYVLEPEALKYIPDDGPFDFSKDLFPLIMADNMPLYGYNAKGYWRDVGNPNSYREATLEILGGKINLPLESAELPPNVEARGKVILGKNVKLGQNVVLQNCVLGNGVVVKDNVTIKDSVIWDNTVIGSNSNVNYAVICHGVVLGQNVTCEKGCIIAENTEVGNYVVFDKDIMVWPDKQIEDYSILSSNLIWGDKWKNSIFEGGKVTARTNVELSADLSAKLGQAFGSILPKGSSVPVSRDYNRGSRMLKRAFLGGLVSAGVDAVDIRMSTVPVLKNAIKPGMDVGGVYFKQYPLDPNQTEIQFLDAYGIPLDANTEKNIERLFFRENFRRVPHDEIGNIQERPLINTTYIKDFLTSFDDKVLSTAGFKIVVDLINGTTGEIFPRILNSLGIDTVVLNAYQDERKLARTQSIMEQNVKTLSSIVTNLNADLGMFISPHGERLFIATDTGEYLTPDKLCLAMIKLMDMTANGRRQKIYVPVMVPTVLDKTLKNTDLVRGKFTGGLKAEVIRDYDMVGGLASEFIFPKYSMGSDAMFAAVKGLEMLQKLQMSLSEVMALIPPYHYVYNSINCPTDKKGYLMRKMGEVAMGKDASFVDGIKIYFPEKSGWVLMLPDQYDADVHLYAEAETKKMAETLAKDFQAKIFKWIEDTVE